MRGPHYSLLPSPNSFQEYKGHILDGFKFCDGSHSTMTKGCVKQITEMAHKHNVYESTGDWAEHLLRQRLSASKEYVQVSTILRTISQRLELLYPRRLEVQIATQVKNDVYKSDEDDTDFAMETDVEGSATDDSEGEDSDASLSAEVKVMPAKKESRLWDVNLGECLHVYEKPGLNFVSCG